MQYIGQYQFATNNKTEYNFLNYGHFPGGFIQMNRFSFFMEVKIKQ